MKSLISKFLLLVLLSSTAYAECEIQKFNFFFLKKDRSTRIMEKALRAKGYKVVEKSSLSLHAMRVDGDQSTFVRGVELWLWDEGQHGNAKLVSKVYGTYRSSSLKQFVAIDTWESTLRKAALDGIDQLPDCPNSGL